MSEGFRLRVKYGIESRLAYLSHLETIRSMERIIRRAGLPFDITEGFSPHMKVAFGPALPVGAGSCGEYLDVRLTEYVPLEQALARMQAMAPSSLMPLECFYVDMRADAIDIAYPLSMWKATFATCENCENTLEELERAFAKLLDIGYIEVVKKKGRKEKVKRVDFEGRLVEGPDFEIEEGHIALCFTTHQGSEGALRPDKFISAALAFMTDAPQLATLTRVSLLKAP